MFPINFQKKLYLKIQTKIMEIVDVGVVPQNLDMAQVLGSTLNTLDNDGNTPILTEEDIIFLEEFILRVSQMILDNNFFPELKGGNNRHKNV